MATATRNISLDVHMWLTGRFPNEPWGAAQQVLVPLRANAGAVIVAVSLAYPRWVTLGCPDYLDLENVVAPPPTHATPLVQATNATTDQDRIDNAAKRVLLQETFRQEYISLKAIGDQFKAYVLDCWAEFVKNRENTCAFPYISILQSSGFGKSRLLYELAHSSLHEATDVNSTAPRLRVLYVSLDKDDGTKFPHATPVLHAWLFPKKAPLQVDDDLTNGLVGRLFQLYTYASEHWDQVGNDWLQLVLDNSTDGAECNKIRACQIPGPGARQQPMTAGESRVLVLAIHEASCLLKRNAVNQLGWFRRLRRALNRVAKKIAAEYGAKAGIFAILVDTNSRISELVPPASCDSSGRDASFGWRKLLPPFLLTHTMDIKYEQRMTIAQTTEGKDRMAFMLSNLQREERNAREVLASMGRPLWLPPKASDLADDAKWASLLDLAAYKLLHGASSRSLASFNDDSLNGVGSLLCRVGIRPYAWSPLACRAVADAMAILVHMSHTNEQLVTTYSSEPILTFGAARVWHQAQGAFERSPTSVAQTSSPRGYGHRRHRRAGRTHRPTTRYGRVWCHPER